MKRVSVLLINIQCSKKIFDGTFLLLGAFPESAFFESTFLESAFLESAFSETYRFIMTVVILLFVHSYKRILKMISVLESK